MTKLGLSFTVSLWFQHRTGVFGGPDTSSVWRGSGRAAKWLQDPLKMCVEKEEQKREETRKIQTLEVPPLKPLVWGAKSDGDRYPGCREGRLKPRSWLGGHPWNVGPTLPPAQGWKEAAEPRAEHASWCSQTFLHGADQPVSYHGGTGGSSRATASRRERWAWEWERHHANSRMEGCSGNSKKG